jgi:hypothetical protein
MTRRASIKEKILRQCVVDDGTGCWIWTGGTSGSGRGGGYGRFRFDGGTMATHKAMWICEHGPVPPGKQLDHNCQPEPNRLCCNPAHLELVTHLQNQKRRDKRLKAKRAANANPDPANPNPERLSA